MKLKFAHAVNALFLSMSLASCTCREQAPAVPPAPAALPTRAPGFQATIAPMASPKEEMATPSPRPTTPAVATPGTEAAKLPEDFPSDVPIFKGATVSAVQKLGGGAHNVIFSTNEGTPAEIFDFYKQDLTPKGYKVEQEYQTEHQSFLSFRKGQLITNVVIASDPGNPDRKVVAIMYQVEEPIEEF